MSETKKAVPGVVYIAHLAPGMTVPVVKALLSEHAPISRLYLAPEDASVRRRRGKLGGGSGERYIEGWVEFESKKDAKNVANMLNGSRVGSSKGRRFYDDLWSLKYLSGFTWAHLLEKETFERKQREQRLRLELSQAKREDEKILKQLKIAKQVEKMDERRGTSAAKRAPAREYTQLEPILKKRKEDAPSEDA